MTLKLIVISLLALLLLIPLGMIDSKIHEREAYRYEAQQSIANSWTGNQLIHTPMLVVPYVYNENVYVTANTGNRNTVEKVEKRGRLLLVPDQIEVETQVDTQHRKRGIYAIPVYRAEIKIRGNFDQQRLREQILAMREHRDILNFEAAFITLAISDPRGLAGRPTLAVNDAEQSFAAGSNLGDLRFGLHSMLLRFSVEQPESMEFEANIELRGMDSLQYVMLALDSHLLINANWPHPEFNGAFLPIEHNITDAGFSATWQTNQFATGVLQDVRACAQSNCELLSQAAFGVKFNEGVDVYLQSQRAVKYGILFIGLSFVTFFIFETMKNMRIHPVQYTLVGLAIAVFYLLLVSLSEHIAFGISYIIAAAACVALLSYYIRFVLGSWKNSFLFALLYCTLYAVLFVILGSEDTALLMGAMLVFVILSAVMVITRNVDWYEMNLSLKTFKSPFARNSE